jgi:hypothetical protein
MKAKNSAKKTANQVSDSLLWQERRRKIDLILHERKYKIRDFLLSQGVYTEFTTGTKE